VRWALIDVAQAAGRSKDTYVGAHERRLTARLGKQQASVAGGHTILVSAYHVLVRDEPWRERGGRYVEERNRQAMERRLVHRLEGLGSSVQKLELAT